jgi:hypothetical protein
MSKKCFSANFWYELSSHKASGKPSDSNSRMLIMSIMFCIVEEIHVVK